MVSLLGLLSGCAVYVPMQAAAPEIRGKGELEVAGSWSLTNRLEVGATYSPLNHLLVRASTSTKLAGHISDSSSYAQNNQYELAVGTYWPLGPHWVVGGLVGFGQAHSQARYKNDGSSVLLLGEVTDHVFDAIYGKYSGEAYATWQPTPAVSLGLTYRLVQLRLTDVTDLGVPVHSAPILRYEPMLYFRLRPQAGNGLVQFQAAVGVSSTFGYDDRLASDRADPTRQFKVGRGYTSVGVAIYPHLLWRKK
ncbi:hypothetical protein GO988_19750 [Hymenobacter sp. HMF4947]|uniref:Outer membrane protein beta-barrel domain-containing protein n=1 Tax=Hymenobacter ginkgonis TaxID=2682976 RepID=A0A7K1TJM6_9BACT|nr:hypothetical protein [Hymenobacter ginkgonis]MVN78572.1 hypothetical protein [Hymenobacter ginkgonis]